MVYETERIRVLLRKVKSENWKKGVNQIVQLLAPLVLQKRLRDIEQKANYHESTTQCLKKRAKEILLKNNKTEPPSADLAKCAATVKFVKFTDVIAFVKKMFRLLSAGRNQNECQHNKHTHAYICRSWAIYIALHEYQSKRHTGKIQQEWQMVWGIAFEVVAGWSPISNSYKRKVSDKAIHHKRITQDH